VQEDFRLIVDLVTVLTAAALGGLLAARLRQPVLLGYLAGGIVVGPSGLGLIKELVQVETLAQLGVAFLLFALGVEFSLGELKRVRAIALGGGALQISLTILATALITLAVGWVATPVQGIFIGAILSLSSTAVVLKSLMERNEVETLQGQVMLGILVVQDLALGLMLAVLPALNQSGEAIGQAIALALLRLGLFALGALAAGIWLIPLLLRFLARTESRELFLLGVVVLCLGIALLTEYLGLSIEMGAFVAGLMISEVEYADQTLAYVEPLRNIFASLFFAAIGMLVDPLFVWENLVLILGLVGLVVLGKFLLITPLVSLFRYSLRTALTAGLGLAQIGEFSFVLASKGQVLGMISHRLYLLILGTTAVTLVITPFVLKLMPRIFIWAEAIPSLRTLLNQTDLPLATSEDLPPNNQIVVCGYGRVGRTLVQMLLDKQYPVTVIDQSEEVIQKLRQANIPYVYGNAASLPVLEKAGVDVASGMAIALPDAMSTRLCLKRSLELSPNLDLVVRANHDRDIEILYQLGAREVVQPEFEASLELATHLLVSLGCQSSEVRQEVDQIRKSHYLTLRPDRLDGSASRNLRVATQEMHSTWYTLPESSPITSMTLEESQVRNLTGVSVMAIQRESGEEIDYPTAETAFVEGDRLLLVGEPEEVSALKQLAEGETSLPREGSACQWLMLPEQSAIAGNTLDTLNQLHNFSVQIRAIRREGRFIADLQTDIVLQEGDRLLICGDPICLERFQELASSKVLDNLSPQ